MRDEWNQNPDFHVLFLPRSGSHMLVDALNGHPSIDCSHIDLGHAGEGELKGHARCSVKGDEKKVILLTRNAMDRAESHTTDILAVLGDNHTKESGVEIHRKHPDRAITRFRGMESKGQKFFDEVIKLDNVLHLRYEDLTENKEMIEIPHKYSKLICDFLDIKQLPLTTSFRKPRVV